MSFFKKKSSCKVAVQTVNDVYEAGAAARGNSLWATVNSRLVELLPQGEIGMAATYVNGWKPLDEKSAEYFNKGE